MNILIKLLVTAVITAIVSQTVFAKQLEGEALRTNVIKRLPNLNHTKLQALMQRVGKKAPKGYYQCLCNSYSTMGNGIGYSPNRDKHCDNTDPCKGGNWGCASYPLPSDSKVIERCMKRAKYDDNSTIIDAIVGAIDDLHVEQKIAKDIKTKLCIEAGILNDELQKLKNDRLALKAKIDELNKERDAAVAIRDEKYKKLVPNSDIAKYWTELAQKERKRIEKVRDECLALKEMALRNAMSSFSRRFSQYMHEEQEIHRENLSTYSKQHKERIKENNKLILENNKNIEKYNKKSYQEITQFTPKEKYKGWEKQIVKLNDRNNFLKEQNKLLDKTVDLIDRKLSLPAHYTNEDIQEPLSKMQDAITDQWLAEIKQDETSAEEKERAFWEAKNDHSRRVAEQLFLGMDRAILESMNPERILAELDPVLKVKQMEDLANTYTIMAEGIDEMLPGLIAREIPEIRPYELKFQNLSIEVTNYERQVKSMGEKYLEGIKSYKKLHKNCKK